MPALSSAARNCGVTIGDGGVVQATPGDAGEIVGSEHGRRFN